MVGCETRVDWRFATPGANRFDTLFAQELPRRGVCASISMNTFDEISVGELVSYQLDVFP